MNTFKTQTILATLAYSALSAKIQGGRKDLAQWHETCEGFNGVTGGAFPDCAFGLKCVAKEGVFTIPGEEKHCVAVRPEPPAQLGETCEGWNESLGMPYPSCDTTKNLFCHWKADEVTLPGAEKQCYQDSIVHVPTTYHEDENGNLWERHNNLDLYGKGDVMQINNWESKGYDMEDLYQIVVDNDWNSVTLRWGTAFFKDVDGQITRDDLGYEEGAEMWNLVPSAN